jgi:hypothetical protein
MSILFIAKRERVTNKWLGGFESTADLEQIPTRENILSLLDSNPDILLMLENLGFEDAKDVLSKVPNPEIIARTQVAKNEEPKDVYGLRFQGPITEFYTNEFTLRISTKNQNELRLGDSNCNTISPDGGFFTRD